MTTKHRIAFFFFTLTTIYSPSQVNYFSFDLSSFALKQKPVEAFSSAPRAKILSCNGTYLGESIQIGFGGFSSFGCGLGLTRIGYEKQWLGSFPGNNKFGGATLNGKIQYFSLPFSLTLIVAKGTKEALKYGNGVYYRRNPFFSGITISYVPSFQIANSFALTTYAAADSSSLFSAYDPAASEFQHTLTIGLCSQIFLYKRQVRLAIEPYLGTGSRYFNLKEYSGTFTYGLKLQLSIQLKFSKISIEKQVNQNSDEQRRLLLQKQKEIEEQLKKQP